MEPALVERAENRRRDTVAERRPTGDRTPDRRAAAVPVFLETGARWAWRFLVVALAIGLLAWGAVRLRVVLIPVLVALLLAALLVAPVDRLATRMPRLVGTWIVLLTLIGGLTAGAYALGRPIARAFGDLGDEWGSAVSDVRDWLRTGPLGLPADRVDELFAGFEDTRSGFVDGLFDRPASTAMLVAEVVGGVLLTLVLTFFFLKDGPLLWDWVLRHVRAARREVVDDAGRAAFGSVQGWIRGVAITGVADAALIGTALVVLGVPAAVPLMVITFFGAFFPIVGATVAGLLAAGVALAAKGVGTAVVVGVVVLVVQQVEGDVLLPIVMKRQVALHPIVILVALAAGAALGGLLGALVAVPLTAAGTAAVAAVSAADADPGDDDGDDDVEGSPG